MTRNCALEPADGAAGFGLTCQAHPPSERVVVSDDERSVARPRSTHYDAQREQFLSAAATLFAGRG